MPQQVQLHHCGHDLTILPAPQHFPPALTCSVFTSHLLPCWQKTPWEIGRRTVDFRWLQRAAQHQQKAEHCDVQNMTSVCLAVSMEKIAACATQASLWGMCITVSSFCALRSSGLRYAKLSAQLNTQPRPHVGLPSTSGQTHCSTHRLLLSCQNCSRITLLTSTVQVLRGHL